MRLPNGYGSITKQKGSRRNPYLVRVPAGLDERGIYIRKILGSYPSYKKAAEALAEYNRDPYDIDTIKLTFADVYEEWLETPAFDACQTVQRRGTGQHSRNMKRCTQSPS